VKLRHFEAIAPICAVCRQKEGADHPLRVGLVVRERGGDILEGVLLCSNCGREYPIIDGIPVLVPALRAYIAQHIFPIMRRDDLSSPMESILGDCCGPGSAFDQTRQHLSSYAFGHYSDLDPEEAPGGEAPRPPLLALLDEGLALSGGTRPALGPILDAGCSVGRASFELAGRFQALVLGVDMSFSMLRLASRALREGEVRYDRRRVGLVYDRRSFPVRFERAEDVDFWACDAQALPFPARSFSLAASLNLLDCVASPYEHLLSLSRVLREGARAVLASPYDWSPSATPIEGWVGGHSQRGPERGASEASLRALLSPGQHPAAIGGLSLVAESPSRPWLVRVHDRSVMQYSAHIVVAEAMGEARGVRGGGERDPRA
jgi:SAM-dependent methyltransferase/uncharacterized protein YbaR (Trm112 family)